MSRIDLVRQLPLLALLAFAPPALAQDALPGVLSSAEMEELRAEAAQQARDARAALVERAKLLGYSEAQIKRALAPSMVRTGHFDVVLSDGTKIRFPWHRIGFAENPYANGEKAGVDLRRAETNKGGVRLHKGVFEAEVYALALKMDAKLAITGDASGGSSFRGAKGGIGAGQVIEVGSQYRAQVGDFVDPASSVIDRAEMMRKFGRSYVAGGGRVGLGADIQAGDVNTKSAEMRVLAETYGTREVPSPGVSGKEVISENGRINPNGGIEYRMTSTGDGVWMSAKLAAEAEKLPLSRATVASQGWGEVGKGFGYSALADGARLIAIQELWLVDGQMKPGTLVHPKGEAATLAESKAWLETVEELRGGKHDLRTFRNGALLSQFKPNADVSSLKVDIVGFNALGSVLNEKTVPELLRSGTTNGQRKILTEGANLAETSEGARLLDKHRGRLLTIPGDLANLGGVHVSNLEAVQNTYQEAVSNERAKASLEATMRSGWERAQALAKKHGVSERKAIELLAVDELMKRSLQQPDATKTNLEKGVISEEARQRYASRSGIPPRVAEKLERFRRADKTLDWSKLRSSGVLREVGGLGHFALALFLKELAVVASTGDRVRIEEFFDGLMTTDFYKHYGLFVAGARVSEVAYVKYLERYVRPRFVSGLLKTNLVLAAGMALPMIVEGTFEGKAFAISLGSLGLSVTAIQGGVGALRWVSSLKKARDTGLLARVGLRGGTRLARVGGWFYTVAELAVILYVAEKVDKAVNDYLDLKKARETLGEAGVAFVDAASKPGASAEEVDAAAQAYHQAWIDYRDFLYGPLMAEEIVLSERLQKLARRAKLAADEREAALTKLRATPALKARIEQRHGSLENYADNLVREAERELDGDVNELLKSYENRRAKLLTGVYEDGRRAEPFLYELEGMTDWALSGARPNAASDPYRGSNGVLARKGRERTRAALEEALSGASKNRLQAYDDEAALFATMATIARDQGRRDVAEVLERRRGMALVLRDADKGLITGNGLVDTSSKAGIEAALRKAMAEQSDD